MTNMSRIQPIIIKITSLWPAQNLVDLTLIPSPSCLFSAVQISIYPFPLKTCKLLGNENPALISNIPTDDQD